MPIMNEYSAGAPCWFELACTDQATAKKFYSEIFGWTVNDFPLGPNEFYTMFQFNGRDVAAAYSLPEQARAKGMSAHWNIYFNTPNVDESAAKAEALGGKLMQPPFDVMDVGRMVNVVDPGGAGFALWEKRRHFGAGLFNELNAVCWCELATTDTAQARDFYVGLFGWDVKGAASMASYLEYSAGGSPCGGLLQMDAGWGGIPSHWSLYVNVADCDAVAAKVKALGGEVFHGPFDAPGVGRIAMLGDPQGTRFQIITLARQL